MSSRPGPARPQRAPARRGVALVLAAALALSGAPDVRAWGFSGHRLVTARATRTLPRELRVLFEANADWLAEHSLDPDLWRGAGHEDEGPNHFLDLDALGQPPFEGLTHDEGEHRLRLGDKAAEQGRVPWRVAEVYAELVAAFRAGDAAAALRQAASLAHYVADAHVPLHAVQNYDGQDTGQKGLHARWESALVERFEQQLGPQVEPGAASRVDDPTAFTFDTLRASFAEAAGVFASDLACRGSHDWADTRADDRYDDAYYSKMYAREERRLVARLSASAEGVGRLWLSAWEDAGRPPLDAAFRFAHVRGRAKGALLSLDGASARVLDEALARGLMPHLARLWRDGARARGVIASLPAKTAPGHAALFTGAWSERNGIVANEQPRPGASLREFDSGFSADLLRAEPLWISAAREGQRATVVSGPQTYPFEPFTVGKRFGGDFTRQLTLINGYQARTTADGVLDQDDVTWDAPGEWPEPLPAHVGALRRVSLRVADALLEGLLYDDPEDASAGFDTLLLRQVAGLGTARLKPAATRADAAAFARLTVAFEGGPAALFLRLYELAPDGSRLLLYHAGAGVLKTSPATLAGAVLDETGGFVPNSAAWTYERGELGTTLAQGGDGLAEERYLETVALALQQFRRLFDFARTRTAWGLLVLYVPFPDDFLHVWLGLLDPSLPSHDARLGARLQPFFDRALGLVDDYVGAVQSGLPPDAYLAIAADHGQVGADRVLRANVALRDAGLLAIGEDGQIDLARTRALSFRDAGFVVLNRSSRPGGIVTPAEEHDVVRRVRAALLRARGVEGRPVVLDVLDLRGGGDYGAGSADAGGDLYLSLAPGYFASGALDGPVSERVAARGQHQLDHTRPGLPSTLLLHGPGIPPGADLGTPRAIDVAPTLACLLGLAPPAQATGRVLSAACQERARP